VPVETGVFQASMDVRLLNQGPVTIVIDSVEPKAKWFWLKVASSANPAAGWKSSRRMTSAASRVESECDLDIRRGSDGASPGTYRDEW